MGGPATTPPPNKYRDHDGSGEAPDHMTMPPIETDQTRAQKALVEQRRIAKMIGAPPEPASTSPDPGLRLAPLYAALAKAQGAFPEIPKNRTAVVRMKKGGQFSFKYSDLSDLINATRPSLAENGLAVFQVPSDDLNQCITTLAHESGLVLVGHYPIKHSTAEDRLNPGQDWAISWAYARRYGMSGLLGIAAEETIEGDKSGKTSPEFEAASGDGILSVRGVVAPPSATKAEKAKLFSKAIEDQFGDAKTEAGLDGAWRRNEEVINALQDHFRSDYDNVLEAYGAAQARMFGERSAPNSERT